MCFALAEKKYYQIRSISDGCKLQSGNYIMENNERKKTDFFFRLFIFVCLAD